MLVIVMENLEGPASSHEDPLTKLQVRLRRLYRHAGEPSTRDISALTGKAISHTTVSHVLRCTKVPRWEQLERVVEALQGNTDEFRSLWIMARDSVDLQRERNLGEPYLHTQLTAPDNVQIEEANIVNPGKAPRNFQLDAIVVPTVRTPNYLAQAVQIARATEALLIILCSPPVQARQVIREYSHYDDLHLIAADFRFTGTELLALSTSSFPDAINGRSSDLSDKRNAALLLARMLKWRTLLFLDDDIGLLATDVQDGLESLTGYSAISYPISWYPDSSVISHAEREIYGDQRFDQTRSSYPSGSALLLDPQATTLPFFPNIYNEDWLFLYDWIRGNRVAMADKEAVQVTYDPFIDSDRAAREEFGEVVTWGIYWLLAHSYGPDSANEQFWTEYLDKRKRLIALLLADASRSNSSLRQRMETALKTAERRRKEIRPKSLAKYVTNWRSDLDQWTDRLNSLPDVDTVQEALSYLGLQVYFELEGNRPGEAAVTMRRQSGQAFDLGTLASRMEPTPRYGFLQALADVPRKSR